MYGLDLFSGIGGITKALEGYVTPVAYCELDPYPRAVLLSRMGTGELPVAPIWDDVTTLTGDNLPHVDIIYGGFPCQDISVAAQHWSTYGTGLDGKRSGLFSEICRLAKETKAEWIFLENVPNIRIKGLGTVLKTLAELGYDTRYGMLSAANVGANHKRQRWFLLAHTNGSRLEGRDGEKLSKRASEQPSRESSTLADSEGVGLERHENAGGLRQRIGEIERPSVGPVSSGWWDIEPNVGRVAHGVPKRVDRLRALGNAVVPAQAREAFERLMGLK